MGREFFHIKSSKNDAHEWGNIPYTKGENGLYMPESSVISLHAGWADMHFHNYNREKYAMFLNCYDVYADRDTHVQSGEQTIEFSMMLHNDVFNHLGGLNPGKISKGSFNITYLPFVDSLTKLEKGQFYCSLDIHLKELFVNELRIDFPELMEPFLNARANKSHKRLFPYYAQATIFMQDVIHSILASLSKGQQYLPLVDKDVEALIAHGLAYNPEVDLAHLNMERLQLMNEVYHKIINNPSKFPGTEVLRELAQTNSTTLNNLFKQTFNITMKQCWIRFRMDRALYMVVHEREKLITDIADILGYSCLENFSKAFSGIFKHSPLYFRDNDIDFDALFQVNF